MVDSKKRNRGSQKIEPQLFGGRRQPRGGQARRALRRGRRRRSLFWGLIRFSFVLAFIGMAGIAAMFGYIWFTLDQQGLFRIPEREPGIIILASDGSVLAEQGSFHGDDVRLAELPDYVPNAVIAIEDRRFRSHYGVDPIGLLRAIYANLRAGRVVQGGSTLTQQLAKNLFLNPERTIERKLQEVVLAVWLESHFSKEEILQLYLNRVYFGAGATGIEKAAKVYFQKPASELTTAEAAMLAGVLRAPSTMNPVSNPDAAAERARLVLRIMADAGFITPEEAAESASRAIEARAQTFASAKHYVIDWVNEQLPEFVKDYEQSLVVETTIDPVLQAQAEAELRKELKSRGAKLGVKQGALVIMDGGGAVLAMVGGSSYRKSQFNRVTNAKRQPGSVFKPFVFLAALERGYTPDTVEVDEPVRIGNWTPENYRKKYLGPVSLETALALSLNTVAAKLAVAVGPPAVAAAAHRLGIVSPLGEDASLALGTSEVTLLELTSAFVPFSNGGYPVSPFAVTRILTRDGRVVYERNGSGFPKAITDHNLYGMNRMMRLVVSDGTGSRAAFPDFDVAGKTGTSQDYRDAWFVGYTSDLIAGVWVGNDDNSPTKKVTGGLLPAEIWRNVMEPAHRGLTPRPLPGEPLLAMQEPPEISEGQYEKGAAEESTRAAPPEKKRGFLERLFGGFSRKDRVTGEAEPGEKRKLTAHERMMQRQEQR